MKPTHAGFRGGTWIWNGLMKLQIPGSAIDCHYTTFSRFELFAQWGLIEALQRKQSNAYILNVLIIHILRKMRTPEALLKESCYVIFEKGKLLSKPDVFNSPSSE